MKKHGFVLGKFMPPHVGHLALLRFAKAHCEQLTVLVESRFDEPMTAPLRAEWIHQALYGDPNITVIPLLGDHPQAPPEINPAPFWAYWQQIIQTHCPNIDVLISSEDYGKKLAADQGVEWIPFDRHILPTSGTLVRDNPWERWWDLIEPARRTLVRKVLILGPESTGKSVLANHLINLFPTVGVPEYAADWIARHPGVELGETQLSHFFQAQIASSDAISTQANRWMVEDSHPLTTSVWAEHLGYPALQAEIDAWCQSQMPPDLTLLTHPEGSTWVADIHRGEPTDRMWFFQAFEKRLQALGWKYDVLQGDWKTRTRRAEEIVQTHLTRWKQSPMSDWTTQKTLNSTTSKLLKKGI